MLRRKRNKESKRTSEIKWDVDGTPLITLNDNVHKIPIYEWNPILRKWSICGEVELDFGGEQPSKMIIDELKTEEEVLHKEPKMLWGHETPAEMRKIIEENLEIAKAHLKNERD